MVIALRARFTNTAAQDIRRGGSATNAPALGEEPRGYGGIALVVTNPVDLMARPFGEVSGCSRVFGIGSNLDSARYRLTPAQIVRVPPSLVSGHAVGEHGDRALVCASTTSIADQPITVPMRTVTESLRERPALIRDGIGRTRCGPAGTVLSTLRKALGLHSSAVVRPDDDATLLTLGDKGAGKTIRRCCPPRTGGSSSAIRQQDARPRR
ncbi:hypothetical protein ACFUJY_23650 [Streptomyces sp. NPDC057249]|uniref:hypothetical protein n=1 Tax=Streptomyces sp. NPDC057249 TaxID=3346067 RepID=UPI003642E106